VGPLHHARWRFPNPHVNLSTACCWADWMFLVCGLKEAS
jgi:hypothetical protein